MITKRIFEVDGKKLDEVEADIVRLKAELEESLLKRGRVAVAAYEYVAAKYYAPEAEKLAETLREMAGYLDIVEDANTRLGGKLAIDPAVLEIVDLAVIPDATSFTRDPLFDGTARRAASI